MHPCNEKSSINGGLNRKIINNWSIFQHAMFDYPIFFQYHTPLVKLELERLRGELSAETAAAVQPEAKATKRWSKIAPEPWKSWLIRGIIPK